MASNVLGVRHVDPWLPSIELVELRLLAFEAEADAAEHPSGKLCLMQIADAQRDIPLHDVAPCRAGFFPRRSCMGIAVTVQAEPPYRGPALCGDGGFTLRASRPSPP